ncbi:anti-sigma factor [Pseudogemmobacter faecipullorum]|uniref:Anti-sigma factor n=1 Tax=Pseudogemmobacter faecipullorum TaxID=2755041 RepID=A0ABS8CSI2_9RHOB|nr:anti-sigma factor [Pseudogemmobacter faecipullorum]MCB5412360.1 anti-sigma factor [Pseudogemmobacter faecipullorum]
MSDADMDRDLTDGGDDILAAEFVLGVLPAADQTDLARRVERDAAFARLVAQWEERLAPMAEGFIPASLPAAVKRALDLRLFGQPAGRRGIWSSLAFWRGLAGATTAAFLLAVTLPGLRSFPTSDRLAASLTAEGSSVTYLVLYDSATGSVSLAHMSGEPVEGRDFQLWIARGAEAPVSLGVIPAGVSTRVPVTSDQIRALMTTAAHMAISLEPPGGSPTGLPTGPVLAVGDLLDI